MRFTIMVICVFSASVLTVCAQENAKEQEALQGTWIAVSQQFEGDKPMFFDGKHFPKNSATKMTFKANKIAVRFETPKDGDYEWTYKLDPSKKPRQIDIVYRMDGKDSKPVLGIFRIENDTLTMCFGEKERPTDFATKADDGRALFVLKRAAK